MGGFFSKKKKQRNGHGEAFAWAYLRNLQNQCTNILMQKRKETFFSQPRGAYYNGPPGDPYCVFGEGLNTVQCHKVMERVKKSYNAAYNRVDLPPFCGWGFTKFLMNNLTHHLMKQLLNPGKVIPTSYEAIQSDQLPAYDDAKIKNFIDLWTKGDNDNPFTGYRFGIFGNIYIQHDTDDIQAQANLTFRLSTMLSCIIESMDLTHFIINALPAYDLINANSENQSDYSSNAVTQKRSHAARK